MLLHVLNHQLIDLAGCAGGNRDPAYMLIPHFLQLLFAICKRSHDSLCTGVKSTAIIAKDNASAVPFEQRDTETFLQSGDTATHRGLGHMQGVRCRCHIFRTCYCKEVFNLKKIHK